LVSCQSWKTGASGKKVEASLIQNFDVGDPHVERGSSEGPTLSIQRRTLQLPATSFKPALARAELDRDVRFHELRHTCAALMIEQGAHPKEIQLASVMPRSRRR